MSINDNESAEVTRANMEHHKRVAETISRASSVLKEKLSLDVDLADADLKYSEWMAALATASLAFTLSSFEKIHKFSWLSEHNGSLNTGLVIICMLLLAAVGCSAKILSLFRSVRAGFNETRTLGSAQEVLLLNHVPVVAAQAEVDAVLSDSSTLDFVYKDIVEMKGGGLVRMAYNAKAIDPNSTYKQM